MQVAGFDGWKSGWVGVLLQDGRFQGATVSATIAEAMRGLGDASVIGVDIPMTMPSGPEPRPAEREAKRMLGRRSSTIFLTPPDIVLQAASYGEARRISTQRFGRSISAQAYALRHRILETVPLAGEDDRLYEIHPELAFMAMSGGTPVAENKKTWAGQMIRRRLLRDHGINLPEELGDVGAVPPDDILDAAAAAWSAARIAAGTASVCPSDGQHSDGHRERLSHIWF
jgi:predicted RNase H-like nuclease